jgi:signal transduction histidine kinase
VNRAWPSIPWALVIAAATVVSVESVLEIHLADWPIYVTFLAVYLVVYLFAVEVLPGLILPIPNMAVAIGFLYIGGLPIILLRALTPPLVQPFIPILPERLRHHIAEAATREAGRRFWDLWAWAPKSGTNAEAAAEWAIFAIGLALRWWIVRALVPQGLPAAHPGAIALAELGGYAVWGLLSLLPIFPDRALLPLPFSEERAGFRSALQDIGLVVTMALTPFVFLITYGYRAEGLVGAAAWSLATLGPHLMLKRLNERRLVVEEQKRRLEVLNRELEHRERLSAIGKMSSVVSHQILHQLGVIGIYADLIRNTEGEDGAETALAQARENARAIEGALRDVNRVLTDLLVFSKDLRLNLYEHPLEHFIEECLEDCRADAAARNVSLTGECNAGIDVTLDKLKMKQAVMNVLRNAMEVSSPGSEIHVRGQVRDGFAEVAISDQGPGISEPNRETIFTPFFTTKEHGTGLGLAIAREFTEAHGGTLDVEGAAGESGAKFVFRLPLRRA